MLLDMDDNDGIVPAMDGLWSKAAAYCAAAEHCTGELRLKLAAWGASDTLADAVIQRLYRENFLDDGRYCRAVIHDKFCYNKWGRVKIACWLRQKGLPDKDIDMALATIDEEEYEVVLAGLLRAKLKGLKAKNDYELRSKLHRFAQGRGFEYAVVERVGNAVMG